VAELRAVTKTVGDGRTRVDILAGLDAVFEAGRLVAVTGPSGSGKTTLLHLLAGLTPPTRGEVLVLGTSITALSRGARAELRRRHVALVAQQLGLIPFLSARDNVALALALRSQADGAADERAEQALAAVGLAERTLQRVGRLSAGERQRVAVARAVVSGAKLILADEPTARLDESNSIAIALLLANLAATHGVAIICATHDSLVVEQAHSELPLTRASTAAAATITDE
jgi:ABC-type lipoprotein export system ATPase subunit